MSWYREGVWNMKVAGNLGVDIVFDLLNTIDQS